jgi:sporulation integral membrane protein YlbJ
MILKNNFYVVRLKRNLLPLLFLGFTFCLLIFSKSNLPAVKSGLSLWANSVVPSLFPFFVATELLMHTNVITLFGNLLNRFMKPLFNIRGEGSFAFIMGIISGYPVGAKIASNFRQNNICSKEECERLLSFTNNSGPLFIIGTVGILMFKNTTIGILLFVTHLLACITVGFIFRYWKKDKNTFLAVSSSSFFNQSKKSASFSNLGEILAESITSSISTILLIGGFVVIFSSIISIFKASGLLNSLTILLRPLFQSLNIDTSFIQGILTGILEITNGIHTISSIPCKKISLNIIFTAFLLGFGGISVLLQVWSITSKTDLSIKPYVYGKLLQGILAAFYSYLLMNIFPFFNFDLI